MRVVITGARDAVPPDELIAQVLTGFEVHTLVHGMAKGVDKAVAEMAADLGWNVHWAKANWDTHGKAAGPIRNRKMLEGRCDCCPDSYDPVVMVLAFHDDLARSKGTQNCIIQASQLGIPVLLTPW